jgi:hypothetical protein
MGEFNAISINKAISYLLSLEFKGYIKVYSIAG